MSREANYMRILEATARVQENVAAILEAKAFEAEKSRSWITRQVHHSLVQGPEELFKLAEELHGAMLEVIEGVTKMELGLARNLKTLLDKNDPMDGFGGGFGDFDGMGGGRT
ncbi:restriction endonuclease subunit S [Paenibacillus cymbidii]|uniref:restriction endonuclease subunit S n=1 Tax=Paenibacillus cymbidii TaxID=1639034 RepID=UPI0010802C00|nr:restriction endonuclease subunit S [Paenibacillus cymbidii]